MKLNWQKIICLIHYSPGHKQLELNNQDFLSLFVSAEELKLDRCIVDIWIYGSSTSVLTDFD